MRGAKGDNTEGASCLSCQYVTKSYEMRYYLSHIGPNSENAEDAF